MLSIGRLAAGYQAQGSVGPLLWATWLLPHPFQFLSLCTAFTGHAFNGYRLLGEKDTQTDIQKTCKHKTVGKCNDRGMYRVLWECR